MSTFTISFGMRGSEDAWYLRNGPSGFTPIDISALPGDQPTFAKVSNQIAVSYVRESFTGGFLYGGRVGTMTYLDGRTVLDQIPDWNVVKNAQLLSSGAQNFFFDGFVHVDAQIGLDDTAGSTLVLNGTKRGNIITGAGDDVIDIRVVEDQNSVWVTSFRINTGGGDDLVSFKPLDIAAELAAGDLTFLEAVNKPGLPLIASGEGRTTFTALGSGDDRFEGFNSNDQIAGQSDDGTVTAVYENAAPSGYAYSIGGATSGGHNSKLYRIELATGVTTEVGAVTVPAPGKSGSNLDVESLALNPVDGMLYGFVVSTGNVTGLIKVDPLTAATTYIGGTIGAYKSALQDFTFGTDGKLYFASEGDLVSVDPATGAFTIIGDNTLSKKVGALASDPMSGKLFGLVEDGAKTLLVEISSANGTVLKTTQVANLPTNSKLEGASFDSAGTLWAVDRVSGDLVKIDPVASAATKVSRTLSVSQQTGDGFEALAIDTGQKKILTDLVANGGDHITTGAGFDRVNYSAGDGVDVITDFDLVNDTLHIAGYDASHIRIDVFGGDTFIRFTDASADGFVDNVMIELSGVTGFNASMIVYGLSTAFPEIG
ncbi:DUF6923 family protein [Sphingomonas sp. CFBP 13720]|uniref:DUF6923 family protein n=1 Tax=Sphingomonas sp. CFBP 13720 TaxID=2775302 RepID=UPI00177D66A6|nr:hypothetical protein [Sphingomonas sp. CFBP 13720]MBD8680128.1 hypothetical protein [Sphingomonas sp. CFBP 13720]